ncbi:MAG: hypothetical protein KQH53_10415 [Desulfarculaceae bacterium]|nr:hypothetical protein [Desulfarculaceae bacterium]
MSRVLPIEIEKYLDHRYSHLVSRIEDPELPDRIRRFLEERGTRINQQGTIVDEAGENWAVFSFAGESARPLVLELLENGYPANIRGIDAKMIQNDGSENGLP